MSREPTVLPAPSRGCTFRQLPCTDSELARAAVALRDGRARRRKHARPRSAHPQAAAADRGPAGREGGRCGRWACKACLRACTHPVAQACMLWLDHECDCAMQIRAAGRRTRRRKRNRVRRYRSTKATAALTRYRWAHAAVAKSCRGKMLVWSPHCCVLLPADHGSRGGDKGAHSGRQPGERAAHK